MIKEGTSRQNAAVDKTKSPEFICCLPQSEIKYPCKQNEQFGVHTSILEDSNFIPQRVSVFCGTSFNEMYEHQSSKVDIFLPAL
jgi:hypothetical protein